MSIDQPSTHHTFHIAVFTFHIFFLSLYELCARMCKIARHIFVTLLLLSGLVSAERIAAQYYSWGVDSPQHRWRQMKSDNYRVVYPDTAENIASRMMFYLDIVKDDVSYGYRHPAMSIPFVVHPENFNSNGLVMWMPRRVEFLSTPTTNSYATPWLKQLIAHEYRHAVQYNNLNRGVFKAFSYILGQQSSTISLLVMPLWIMEGDAVMTETEMTTFGRGMQPSFTLTYRAYGDVAGAYDNIDKWFCGSYNDYIPDHYQLGYLMSRHTYNRFGRCIGDDIAEITTRRPYMVFSTQRTIKALYGITDTQLFRETFNTLSEYWSTLPTTQTTTYIPVAEPKSHTIYSHPQVTYDGDIILLKEDLDRPTAFVRIDSLGVEHHIAYTGYISTRPALSKTGRIWWTEYRRSPLFDQEVNSTLCYMDLADERPRYRSDLRNALYPTPTEGHGLAWVEYTPDGIYSIVTEGTTEFDIDTRTALPCGSEIHGLAWDDTTKALYAIITDDEGMHIARVVRGGTEQVTRPSYSTISDLRAAGGKLYFGSIASGIDELHYYDIAEDKEYRISQSRYGSFSPTPYDDNRVVATSYDRRGYLPVWQDMTNRTEVTYTPLPEKRLLPEGREWNVVNLDTVRFTDTDYERIAQQTPPKHFSKFGHMFNIHSWAPASYDPYEIIEESSIAFNFGGTIMSQNILSTTEGFLTYGWNGQEGSVWKGLVRYYGLGVNLWVRGTYGGQQTLYGVKMWDPVNREEVYPEEPKRGRYYSAQVGATLPILLQRGYHTRQLALSTVWSLSNGMTANVGRLSFKNGVFGNIQKIGYSEGVQQLTVAATFQDYVRQAHRDFLPPYGFVAQGSYTLNPTSEAMGHLVVGYTKLYTRGFYPHHSFSIEASYQNTFGGFQSKDVLSDLSFKSTRLLPRGFSSYEITNKHYVATALNYHMPIWYPEAGVRGIVYFKRVRLNTGLDLASFYHPTFDIITGDVLKNRQHIGSYGIDLGVDFNILAMPEAATISAKFSLYRRVVSLNPLHSGKFYYSFSIGLPF